jgi:hypothetical protein
VEGGGGELIRQIPSASKSELWSLFPRFDRMNLGPCPNRGDIYESDIEKLPFSDTKDNDESVFYIYSLPISKLPMQKGE